jgi:hypothetical protein
MPMFESLLKDSNIGIRRNAHDDRGDGTVGPHPVSTALCSVRGLPEGRTSVLGEGGGGI